MEYSRRPTKSIPKENQLKILNKIYQTYLVSTTYSPPLESSLTNVTGQQIGQYSLTQNDPNILSKSNNSATGYQINKFNALLPRVTYTVRIAHTENHLAIQRTYGTFR